MVVIEPCGFCGASGSDIELSWDSSQNPYVRCKKCCLAFQHYEEWNIQNKLIKANIDKNK